MKETDFVDCPIIKEDTRYTGKNLEEIFKNFDWEDDNQSRKQVYKYMNGMWYIQEEVNDNYYWNPDPEQNIFPIEGKDFTIVKE